MHYVIGSGPTGITAAFGLLRAGLPVTLLDGGIELESEINARVKAAAQRMPETWSDSERSEMAGQVSSSSKGVQLKKIFGSDFPYRAVDSLPTIDSINVGHLTPSLATGGLSTVWGAAVLPYSEQEMKGWPITPQNLREHYEKIHSFMPLAAQRDDLATIFPLPLSHGDPLPLSSQAQRLYERLESNRARLRSKGVWFGRSRLAAHSPVENGRSLSGCVSCGMCLYGCPYGHIYSSAHTINQLTQFPNFTHRKDCVVQRLEEGNGQVKIFAKDRKTGEEILLNGDAVFLGAGVLSTARILLESLEAFDTVIRFPVSEYFLLPLLSATQPLNGERLHTLSQIFLEIFDPTISPQSCHLQLYTYSDLYEKTLAGMFRPLGFLGRHLAHMLGGRLNVIQGYLHSDFSSKISMRLTAATPRRLELSGEVNPAARVRIKSLARKLVALIPVTKLLPLVPMLQVGLPGDGRHVGGTFPMGGASARFSSDLQGRPAGYKNIFIVDASSFPTIPASTITYAAMANASRIVSEYAQSR